MLRSLPSPFYLNTVLLHDLWLNLKSQLWNSKYSIMEHRANSVHQRDGLRTPIIESFIWLQNTICKVQTQIPIPIDHSVMLVEASQRDGNSYESNKNDYKRYLIRDVIFPWKHILEKIHNLSRFTHTGENPYKCNSHRVESISM